MKSLSGKKLDPGRQMNNFQIMILGGLQDKPVFAGAPSKLKRKSARNKLEQKRLKSIRRSERMQEVYSGRSK